jgi:N-acetylated-alpha-linked acidic dipeptidase
MIEGMMRLAATTAAALALLALGPAPAGILGFSTVGASRERADESRFLDLPSAQGALDHAEAIGARPHYAGTPADRALASYTAERLREYGFSVRIEPFAARVDTPRKLALELYADGKPFTPRDGFHKQRGTPPLGLDLREVGEPSDPDTLDAAVGLPFNAGAGNGDLTAPLVYARHGLPEDFATLRQARVDVRGAIVLIRYGGAFRGLLVRNAQDAGAAGAILYSDPADDGAARGATYPEGPWRPSTAIQRGSLGEGIRIPVLPISGDNARILLRTLRGRSGPDGWAGALDAPYPLGRGPASVHLVVQMNHEKRTLWNTVGTLRGSVPAQSVILGAHRDAWVYGVGDNGAGTISLLETARGLGYLARSGWRPKRTIVVALWDGEEIGLLGSAAFARAHAAEIERGCIAYLNADQDLTGTTFGASAVGALAPAIIGATGAVADPARERATLRDRWSAQPHGITVENPGGGSDHESFLYGFGTPSAEMGFSGPFGPYHSSYDTLRYARAFSDPGFVLHRTNAQLYGIVAMRLAAADAVPYAFAALIPALNSGVARIEARAQRDGRTVDVAPLRGAIAGYAAAARSVDDAIAYGEGPDARGALAAVQEVDRVAYGANGYESVAFPAIAAAYAAGDAGALRDAIAAAAATLARATARLR